MVHPTGLHIADWRSLLPHIIRAGVRRDLGASVRGEHSCFVFVFFVEGGALTLETWGIPRSVGRPKPRSIMTDEAANQQCEYACDSKMGHAITGMVCRHLFVFCVLLVRRRKGRGSARSRQPPDWGRQRHNRARQRTERPEARMEQPTPRERRKGNQAKKGGGRGRGCFGYR
jgi:hypothetical protein